MGDFRLPDLRIWRKKYGFSQKKLAEVMKVSLATLRHLELGKGRKPQKRTLRKLASVIEEVETKAAMPAPAASIKSLAKPEPVSEKIVEKEPKRRGRKPKEKIEVTKPEKRRGRPIKVAEVKAVEPKAQVTTPIEITNLDLELISRILRMSGREKLELLQKLL